MKSTTDKVLSLAVGALLVYEAYTLVNKKGGDTISESVWRISAKRPLVPFLLGMLVGHFVWQAADIYEKYEDGA